MSNLFREKNLQRISSPEQLNDYIRVSTPSVWMLLAAVIMLLLGVCVWGVFGHMDTTLPVVAVSENGAVTAYVQEEKIRDIDASMAVQVDGSRLQVASVAEYPVQVDGAFTAYMCHVGNLTAGDWVYAVVLEGDCPEGVYPAEIVIDSVPPMAFVLN